VTAILLALVLAASDGLPVQVQGTARCPTPAEITAIMSELLPATADPFPDIAWVETAGLDLSIALRDAEGNPLLFRKITASGTCADLAAAAAVVIATWKVDQNPALSLQQPGVHPHAQAQPIARPEPVAKTPVQETVAAAPAPTHQPWLFDVASALGTSANSAGFVGTARAEVGVRRRRLGLRTAFTSDISRDQSLAVGRVSWRRLTLGAGPSFVVAEGFATVELHAQLFVGFTSVSGRGFALNRQASDVSPGVASAVRVRRPSGTVRPWIEVGGQFWFAPQAIAILEASESASLPRTDARLMVGISLFAQR
jgi:hypothetical protein